MNISHKGLRNLACKKIVKNDNNFDEGGFCNIRATHNSIQPKKTSVTLQGAQLCTNLR